MIDRDPLLLHSILELIRLVRTSLAEVDRASFLMDIDKIDATAFRVQHIGEAAHHLSATLKARHSELPWKAIVGTRNFLAHNYEDVSPPVLWALVQERLGPLEAMCRAELGE